MIVGHSQYRHTTGIKHLGGDTPDQFLLFLLYSARGHHHKHRRSLRAIVKDHLFRHTLKNRGGKFHISYLPLFLGILNLIPEFLHSILRSNPKIFHRNRLLHLLRHILHSHSIKGILIG